jgi:hypothetical protein
MAAMASATFGVNVSARVDSSLLGAIRARSGWRGWRLVGLSIPSLARALSMIWRSDFGEPGVVGEVDFAVPPGLCCLAAGRTRL